MSADNLKGSNSTQLNLAQIAKLEAQLQAERAKTAAKLAAIEALACAITPADERVRREERERLIQVIEKKYCGPSQKVMIEILKAESEGM